MEKQAEIITCAAYNYLESVEKRLSVSQTAKLVVAGIIFRDVSISSGTQKHFFYAANKGVTQVLHWIHHHSAINGIA